MFGHHKAKRERRKQKREKENFNQEKAAWEQNSPTREKEAADFKNQQVTEKTQQAKADRTQARQEGREDAKEFFSQKFEGMKPEDRAALQYEANKGIQRSHQSANRKLLGDQAAHGIQGKGGVGFAQQKDLQRLAMDAERGAFRDIQKQDSDLALKKQAAAFAGGEGNAAQQQLDKQSAVDELELADEKKRQRQFEDQFYRQFSRI